MLIAPGPGSIFRVFIITVAAQGVLIQNYKNKKVNRWFVHDLS